MVRVLIFGEASQDVMRYHLHRFVAGYNYIEAITCFNKDISGFAEKNGIKHCKFDSFFDILETFKPDFAIGFPGDPISLAAVRRAGIPVYDGGCGA